LSFDPLRIAEPVGWLAGGPSIHVPGPPHSVTENIMKATILLAMALSLVSIEAHAISRYNSRSMSCDRIQAAIHQEGAVILRYSSARNPGLPLYDRYVANGSYCSYGEFAQAEWVPASDTPSCPVQRCAQITYDEH